MHRYPLCVGVAAAFAIAGCSSAGERGPESSPAPAPPTTTSIATRTPASGAAEVSPGGVTTAVGAPAESTEDEYSKACITARTWIDQQGGDPTTHIEPYLKMLQSSDAPGPSTFDTPWSQLSPGRQAAVIVAVQSAADALCG